MVTTSEYAVTITIWVLTLAGTFFGGRAAWRRRRQGGRIQNTEYRIQESEEHAKKPGS
jgi:hypothetical protein